MKTVVLAVFAAALVSAGDYPLGPDSQPQSGVPKGSVAKYELKPGRFYPGTPHTYSIYVPAQYDPAKPAAFMIFLDGAVYLIDKVRVPIVFDNLIAKHDLPPLIAFLSILERSPRSPIRRRTALNEFSNTIL
jgi:gluconolactonase